MSDSDIIFRNSYDDYTEPGSMKYINMIGIYTVFEAWLNS